MRQQRYVSITGELGAMVIYGVIGFTTLLARDIEMREAFDRVVRDARYVFERPDFGSIRMDSSGAELGLRMLSRDVLERVSKFAARFFAPTPQAAYVVECVLALTLLRVDVAEAVDDLRTGRGIHAVVYRGLVYGERPTTQAERAFVGEWRALLKGFPGRRMSTIQRDAGIWADVRHRYGDDLDDALRDGFPDWDKPRLSRATAPFYRAFGMRLPRGPKMWVTRSDPAKSRA